MYINFGSIAPPPQDSESTDLTTVAGPTYTAVLEQLHPSKSIYSFEDKRLPPSPPPPVRGGRVLKETEKVQFANPEMNMSVLSLTSVPRALLDSHTVSTANPLGRFAF